MKGFPGLLNTIGTLLDRSQVILKKVKKSQSWGPHGAPGGQWARAPGTLGPKKQRIMKIGCFFNIEKMRAEILCLEQSSIIQNH